MSDEDFVSDPRALHRAVDLLDQPGALHSMVDATSPLPETGIGSMAAMEQLAPRVLGAATRLGADTAFAHMDPPTPWITWAMSLWNAALNQNLLHPATGPVARAMEETVIRWLSPFFGMSGGHMTPGSTLANLTALWAARECSGVQEVIASASAHVSIAKAAHILGLRFIQLPVDRVGALAPDALPRDLSKTALVLTAGTTSTGAIDDLALAGRAAWTHIDAAWGGPLRLTRYSGRLDGIEQADSVAVSAHKWLFQPKESALIFFRDTPTAHAAISFRGAYLASPRSHQLSRCLSCEPKRRCSWIPQQTYRQIYRQIIPLERDRRRYMPNGFKGPRAHPIRFLSLRTPQRYGEVTQPSPPYSRTIPVILSARNPASIARFTTARAAAAIGVGASKPLLISAT